METVYLNVDFSCKDCLQMTGSLSQSIWRIYHITIVKLHAPIALVSPVGKFCFWLLLSSFSLHSRHWFHLCFLGVLLLVCFFKDTEQRYLARKDWNVRSQIDLFTMLKIKCIDLNSTFYLHLHFLQNQKNMFICFMLANALKFLIL